MFQQTLPDMRRAEPATTLALQGGHRLAIFALAHQAEWL
jgi:hypothetical protein